MEPEEELTSGKERKSRETSWRGWKGQGGQDRGPQRGVEETTNPVEGEEERSKEKAREEGGGTNQIDNISF